MNMGSKVRCLGSIRNMSMHVAKLPLLLFAERLMASSPIKWGKMQVPNIFVPKIIANAFFERIHAHKVLKLTFSTFFYYKTCHETTKERSL